MKRQITTGSVPPTRRGFLVPLVAVVLVIVLCAVALVLDRLWLQAAHVEIEMTAEAAALAAAAGLADDDRLREDARPQPTNERAVAAAVRIAGENLIAGNPARLRSDDVTLGKLVTNEQSATEVFVATEQWPTSTLVIATHARHRNNPVALFFSGLTRQPFGDVTASSEATIDNHIVSVTPFPTIPAPVLPLAILHRVPLGGGGEVTAWEGEIEARQGSDVFGYDVGTRRVLGDADEIPEMTLREQLQPGDRASQLVFADLGTGLDDQKLAEQIHHGWMALPGEQTESLHEGREVKVGIEAGRNTEDALHASIGKTGIAMLFEPLLVEGEVSADRVRVSGLVAVRILDVINDGDAGLKVIIQPAVVATRAAVIADRDESVKPNPYIFRLALTN